MMTAVSTDIQLATDVEVTADAVAFRLATSDPVDQATGFCLHCPVPSPWDLLASTRGGPRRLHTVDTVHPRDDRTLVIHTADCLYVAACTWLYDRTGDSPLLPTEPDA